MTFRSFVTGEDDELKSAYDVFHKAVVHEQGVVRNATLMTVQQLKPDATAAHQNAKDGLAVTQRLESNTKSLLADTTKISQTIESRISCALKEAITLQLRVYTGKDSVAEGEKILDWLSSLSFIEKQRNTFFKHHGATGQRLIDTSEFQT